MNLRKQPTIIILTMLAVITSVFIAFDIQYIVLRSIISLIFLSIVPGFVFILLFKKTIKTIGLLDLILYIIGLSVSIILLLSFLANWALPLLNITNQPLSRFPILLVFYITFVVIGFVSIKNSDSVLLRIKTIPINLLNKLLVITPLLFPILSILGAMSLNNNGSNIFTMWMLGGIATYTLFIIFFKKYISDIVFPWTIWMYSLSLLFMTWLRSWFVSGVDTNIEYHIFQLVNNSHKWSFDMFNNSYNSCLSVTLFPTILSIFTGINDQYIFKIVIPLFFSITPIGVYALLKRYTQNIFAFIATFFFISQSPFLSGGSSIPIRQEVALLFFVLMMLNILEQKSYPYFKYFLFVMFSLSMIVSHYSTSYLAMALFSSVYMFNIIQKYTINSPVYSKAYKILNLKRNNTNVNIIRFNINAKTTIFIILASFLWYSNSSSISNNLLIFLNTARINLKNVFSENVRIYNSSPFAQFRITYQPKNQLPILQNYINTTLTQYKNNSLKLYSNDLYKDFSPKVVNPIYLSPNTNQELVKTIYTVLGINSKIIKIYIIIGSLVFIFSQFKRNCFRAELSNIIWSSMCILLLIMIIPFASISYDLQRTYQQELVFLSLSSVLGGVYVLKFLNDKIRLLALSSSFILYFLFLSGFLPQVIGGASGSIQLNNSGIAYDELFVHKSELLSSDWLTRVSYNNKSYIYTDERSFYKLALLNNIDINRVLFNVFPPTLERYSYVLSSYTNVSKNMAFKYINNERVIYEYPNEFLSMNKNTIYNNGFAEVHK